MRQINTQEVQAISGAGLITGTLGAVVHTGVAAGSAIGSGLIGLGQGAVQAGVIVVKPVAVGAIKTIKFLI